MPISWTCPYCNRPCTIDDNDIKILTDYGKISEEYGYYKSLMIITVCPNPKCRQRTVSLSLSSCDLGGRPQKELFHWALLPESEAKPFPDYIPKAVLDDYKEACLIKNKSPKASATLSRRCLQGMIRDFWKIKKRNLKLEIDALKGRVGAKEWKAIDSVRKIGNIGAHMEKDVNLIIDVEPEEAKLLIELIETLFTDWYIARHEKDNRMEKLIEVAEKKDKDKKGEKTSGESTESKT